MLIAASLVASGVIGSIITIWQIIVVEHVCRHGGDKESVFLPIWMVTTLLPAVILGWAAAFFLARENTELAVLLMGVALSYVLTPYVVVVIRAVW